MLALVAACDALMLGRVAQAQMTAVSLATQIQFVQNMFLSAATAAGAILGAQYWGKGDKRTLEDIFDLMLMFCGMVSILFFLACELCPGALMAVFAGDEQLIMIGSSYLKIAGWSYLITGVSQCYLTIMKVTENVKAGALISSAAVVINIIFNAILIFGLFGIPAMEAKGAALATTIARVIELAICLLVSTKSTYIRPALGRMFSISSGLVKDFFRQCLPLMGGGLCWGVGFTSYTAIMGHMGVDAAAANSVAAVVRDLVCCMCNGIGSAAGIIVGNELGAGRLEQGKKYGIRLTKISFVIGFISMGIVLAVTPLVVNGVILTDKARGYLVWMIAIPLALCGAFVFHWSPLAVYACTCLDEVGKIPWVMIRVRKYKWVRDLTR